MISCVDITRILKKYVLEGQKVVHVYAEPCECVVYLRMREAECEVLVHEMLVIILVVCFQNANQRCPEIGPCCLVLLCLQNISDNVAEDADKHAENYKT